MNAEVDAVEARSGFAREADEAELSHALREDGSALFSRTSTDGSQPVAAPTMRASRLQAGASWLRPMRADWPTAVCGRLERSGVVVRVVVAEVRGSAPRE